MMDTRELLDQEWARLKAAKEDFEAEKRRFESEKLAFEQEKRSGGGQGGGGYDGEYKLFVGNLNDKTDEVAITKIFGKYGSIKEAHVLRDRDGKSKRSCFIKFHSKSDADKAIAAINDKIKDEGQDQAMVVRYARKKADMFNSMMGMGGAGGFGNKFGGWQNSARSSMYGAAQTGAAAAYSTVQNGTYNPYGGATGYGQQQSGFGGGAGGGIQKGPPGANLYVNNLDRFMSEQDVYNMFKEFGSVLSVKVFDGWGIISYDNANSAQAAIQGLNNMVSPDGTKRLEVSVKTQGRRTNEGGVQARYSPY